MAKRLLLGLLMFIFVFSFAACGNAGASSETQQSAQEESTEIAASEPEPETLAFEPEPDNEGADEAVPDTENSILVVYFSRTGEQYTVGVIDKGNTAIVAEMIAEETGADLFEVLPEEDYYPYTYEELTDVAKQEQNEGARPVYQEPVPDLSKYDTVFIGAPVWWGDWPMIMYTFFESNAEELSGKTLVPFSTHEGSGLSGFDQKLSAVFPGSEILDGLAVRGNDAQNDQDGVREEVKGWLADLQY